MKDHRQIRYDTEEALVVKMQSMDRTHPPSDVVVASILFLVIFLLRTILCDKK